MRVLFLHRYGPQAASYRYRFQQYYPYFKEHGVEVLEQSFFSDSYLKKKFKGRLFLAFDVLCAFARRLWFLLWLPKVDAIVLYKDALPYMPFVVEYLLVLKRAPYVVDIDDALYVNYESSRSQIIKRILGDKFKKIFAHSAHVLAGNAILADYARQFSKSVSILPTVVDMNYYSKVKEFKSQGEASKLPLVVGWMGSPTSARGLVQIREALRVVQDKYKIEVRVIGAGKLDLGSVQVHYSDWSLNTELDDLLSFDVGIMPLVDDAWDRGKCGFKLIQYMACGLPVIGSPVGVNESIIDHGRNGFLAMSNEEWVKALSFYIENRGQLAPFGVSAREKVTQKYSLQSAAPHFYKELKRLGESKYE